MPLSRWCLLIAALAAVGGLMLAPAPVVASKFHAACQMAAAAQFAQPGGAADAFTYSFQGALSGCRSFDTPVPPSATLESGRTITVPYYWSYVDQLTGAAFSGSAYATYKAPVAAGTGGCSGGATAGSAIVSWADRSTTVVTYRTSGSAGAVALRGTVVPNLSMTLIRFTGPSQSPPSTSYVVASTRFVSESIRGVLLFEPPNPVLCNHARSAQSTIGGEVGLGSSG